ncbi:MAG: CoA-binding protein [Candidatus Berkiella sp.]
MKHLPENIQQFFTSKAFGVAGASTNREKYGNKVLRCYIQHHLTVYPINPRAKVIEGIACFDDIQSLPAEVKSISVITPPLITEHIVNEAIKKGITNIWMQPGAESPLAVKACQDASVNVIADGSCILVALGFKDI